MSSTWCWRSNSSQKRVEGAVELWLVGSEWDTQREEGAKLVTEAEAWKQAETQVKMLRHEGTRIYKCRNGLCQCRMDG